MERRLRVCSLTESDIAYLHYNRAKADKLVMLQHPKSFQPPSQTRSISQSHKPRYQSLFVITQKINPPSLNPFQLTPSPHPVFHPLPLCHPMSTAHLSFIFAPHGTSLFSFHAPFRAVSLVSTFPTDCALTLQKSKGVLSVLIIHVWWEAPASPHCKLRKKCLSSKYVCVCVHVLMPFCVSVSVLIWSVNLYLYVSFAHHHSSP